MPSTSSKTTERAGTTVPPDKETQGAAPAPDGKDPTVSPTAAAPLAPPPDGPGDTAQAPTPSVAAATPQDFVGYVGEDGEPLDLEDVFDASGTGSVVRVRSRVYVRSRPAGVRTVCTTLAFTEGAELSRAQAQALIARAKAQG